jgi:glycosyltransferase involved in cell wall biosynthesis
MKVLHLTATLDNGGAERQLYLLCKATEGVVENRVVSTAAEGRWAERLRESGIPVDCLRTPLRDPRVLRRLRQAVRRVAPDLVYCWLPSMNLLGALASIGLPVVASVRNVDDWKPWLYRVADRVVAPLWTAVVANSHAGARQAQAHGVPAERIRVVPNGIELRQPLSRLRRSRATVCTVCRLVPQKRVDRVLEVARALPEADFVIAGDGPLRGDLERRAGGNVRLMGTVEDPAWLYASSDFFVLTSEREGTSNALLEAMQAGCVPVVTGVGDNGRIVEPGVSGWVCEASEMAALIRRSLPEWRRLSEAAQNTASKYGVPAMAERTLEIYEQVVTHAAGNADPIPGLHQ